MPLPGASQATQKEWKWRGGVEKGEDAWNKLMNDLIHPMRGIYWSPTGEGLCQCIHKFTRLNLIVSTYTPAQNFSKVPEGPYAASTCNGRGVREEHNQTNV
jgi:hypothetical protein